MTFSRLTLGDPRLRGKPGGGAVAQPCTEPVTYGVAWDGIHSQGAGTLPGTWEWWNGEYIYDPPIQVDDEATTFPDATITQASEITPYTDPSQDDYFFNHWSISADAARSGTLGLKVSVYPGVLSTPNPDGSFRPSNLPCELRGPYPCTERTTVVWPYTISMFVAPGDLVTATFWRRQTTSVTWQGTGGNVQARFFTSTQWANGSSPTSSDSRALGFPTTSFVQHEESWVVPSGATYALIQFGQGLLDGPSDETTDVYIADLIVLVE